MHYDNIILIGFMGSGKSSVGEALADTLDYRYCDTDDIIQKEQNSKIGEIFLKEGEAYFRGLEQRIIEQFVEKKGCIVSTGGGLPIHAKLPKNAKVILLDIAFEEIVKRMDRSELEKRPLFNEMDSARNLYNARLAVYKAKADMVINANQSVDKIVKEITNKLEA